MKVTSYDSQGKIIDVINSDNIVPRHFEFFESNNSVLELFKRVKITCKKDDTFANVLNSTFAESLFNIDYNLFQELPVTPLKMGGKCTCGTFLEAPTFNENNYEPRKLADILNYYGHKSKKQIEIDINSGRIKDIDCLSNSSWIQSLACYANKKTCTYVNRTESKEIAFIIALQSVINRYYLALKNIVNFREISYEDNIFKQIKIMSPFISKNVFRVEPEDVLVYNTNEFIVKLVSNLTTFPEGRIDSYCLLQLLRGDYKPVNKINSNLQLLNFQISTQKIPDVTHTFTIKEFNDNQTVICITDREIESLVDPYIDGNGLDILIQTFNRIYDGYITSYYKQIWDNQISHRKLAVLMPDKIQTWSYLFFDELANYNKIGPTDSLKEQMSFHKLIYSFINCNKPSKILFDGQLISCFFSILKKNNCHNQIGFFEKIH